MTYEIKRFDLLTVFKVSFLVYLVIGFLIGILYALVIMKMMAFVSPFLDNPMFSEFGEIGFFAAIVMALFMAIFLAVIWSIITVIAAAVYNVMAGVVGGLRLELSEVKRFLTPQMPPAQQADVPPQTGGSSV